MSKLDLKPKDKVEFTYNYESITYIMRGTVFKRVSTYGMFYFIKNIYNIPPEIYRTFTKDNPVGRWIHINYIRSLKSPNIQKLIRKYIK